MRSLSLIILVSALLAFAPGDVPVFDNNKWMPGDMDTRNNVLLVEKFKMGTSKAAEKACEKANNDLIEYMKANYPYKFEFVDVSTVESDPKYSDKAKYRYEIMCTSGEHAILNRSGQAEMRYAQNNYHVYDRKADKHYPECSKGSSFLLTVLRPMVTRIVAFQKTLK